LLSSNSSNDSSQEKDENAIGNVAESVMDGAAESHKTHVAFAPVEASSKKMKGDEIDNDDSSDSSDDSSEKVIGNVAESVMDKAAVSHKTTVAVAPVEACSEKKRRQDRH
jgi:hypothetical protein